MILLTSVGVISADKSRASSANSIAKIVLKTYQGADRSSKLPPPFQILASHVALTFVYRLGKVWFGVSRV
jgi:hypothetical protein